MKAILILFLFILASCEKETPVYTGTYTGEITYYLSGQPQKTVARREISNGTDGTVIIHWWDAPDVNCYTIIENGEYQINNVEILAETYCYGVKQSNKLVFCGVGKFIGDSLVESGIVYHFITTDDGYSSSESGTWRGYFKKIDSGG